MTPTKTIYLAGPDVFKPDFVTIRDRLKTMCRANGFIPLSPADGDPIDCDASDLSRQIFLQNIRHIDAADIVMANVQDFRGHEPDSGTVFEIGYAIGRGKATETLKRDMRALFDWMRHGRQKVAPPRSFALPRIEPMPWPNPPAWMAVVSTPGMQERARCKSSRRRRAALRDC